MGNHAVTDPNVNYLNNGRSIMSWLGTIDHKRIGVMYLITVCLAFLVGGIFALLVRLELWAPGKTIVEAATYNKLFTAHGAVMIFMFIVPGIPGALGNFLLPIQLGAKDVAFPKLNLFSLYLFWTGILITVYGLLDGNGADTGWTFYTPYSSSTSTNIISIVTGVFIMGFSSILTGLNFIVTTHQLRCAGMTFFRMPMFVWTLYGTAILQVVATPVLGITLLLLVLERAFGIGFFDPKLGGDPVLFQHFFWFYSHPAVYIMVLPAMGIISEIIPVFSRKPLFGYNAMAYATLGLALVSFLVWGHHMFISGQSDIANFIFSFLTMLTAIPSAIKMFNWTATMYKGSIKFETPMLYAMAFLFTFGIGGLTGISLGLLSVNVHLHMTYYVVAHFHYVMMGGTAMAFFAGLHYWWPKFFGRMYNEGIARFGCILFLIAFNVTFMAQFIVGWAGMPRRYYTYVDKYTFLNQVSTVGSWFIAISLFLAFGNLFYAAFKGKKAPANPWGGKTLEWEAASPPITENFVNDPVVHEGPYEFGIPLTKQGAKT